MTDADVLDHYNKQILRLQEELAQVKAEVVLANTKIANMYGVEMRQERDAALAQVKADITAEKARLEICPACGTEWTVGDMQKCANSIIGERDAALAEVARLREALDMIRTLPDSRLDECGDIARETLRFKIGIEK